jgi:hypothetical protein
MRVLDFDKKRVEESWCAREDSNFYCAGFEPAASAVGLLAHLVRVSGFEPPGVAEFKSAAFSVLLHPQ